MPDIISAREVVVVRDGEDSLAAIFRDHDFPVFIDRPPFGMQLPKSWTDRSSELITVGGSVSFDFAVPALLLARLHRPGLKYVHLSVDADDHFQTPEEVDYRVDLGSFTEIAEKYKCKAWSDDDFARLKEISRQADFHYYVRSFYKKGAMILRGHSCTVKYFGGMHDGQVLRMQGSAKAIVRSGFGPSRITRPDGDGIDVYTARINGDVLEFHFARTERRQ